MKRRLNILCILVILALSTSFLTSIYYVAKGVALGLDMVVEKKMEQTHTAIDVKVVKLLPKDLSKVSAVFPDSMYNVSSGKFIPVMHSEVVVQMETEPSKASALGKLVITLLYFLLMVSAFVLFIRLIVSINRSVLFDWKNVKRLRLLGFSLLLAAILDAVIGYMDLFATRELLQFSGYGIDQSDIVKVIDVVLGLVALIVAEIFSIALKMKEEQELTI